MIYIDLYFLPLYSKVATFFIFQLTKQFDNNRLKSILQLAQAGLQLLSWQPARKFKSDDKASVYEGIRCRSAWGCCLSRSYAG